MGISLRGDDMSEWISVEEKLPDQKIQVWVSFSFPKGESGQGYAIFDDGDWFFDVSTDGDLISRSLVLQDPINYVADITHWMPLPPPPAD
jgi:hypothetical protein